MHTTGPIRAESGAVLVVSLLMLVVLTLLGAAATTNSRLEIQIAANDRLHREAFAGAEYALAVGEMLIEGWRSNTDLNGGAANDGFYNRGEQPAWSAMHWDNTDSESIDTTAYTALIPEGTTHISADPTQLPRFMITRREPIRDSLVIGHGVPTEISRFAIAGRGASASGAFNSGTPAQVIVQTIWAKRFN